ncbi:hypothetical protein DVA81_19560, partial [Acinetobacter baumannii]
DIFSPKDKEDKTEGHNTQEAMQVFAERMLKHTGMPEENLTCKNQPVYRSVCRQTSTSASAR